MSYLSIPAKFQKLMFFMLGGLSCFVIFSFSQASAEIAEEGGFYPNPGIVALREGRWVGSDHLYNLTKNIVIVAEIFKPEKVIVTVTEKMIQQRVSRILENAGINPSARSTPGQPILPFFHMLVMLYPIEKGYVAFCEGRLFEKINIDRVKLDEQMVMQSITWENQTLVLTPSEELENQLYKSIDEIASTFAERFRFYENIRLQIQR